MGEFSAGRLRRGTAGRVILLCASAAFYQVLAIFACLYHLKRRNPFRSEVPAVSILKPVHGAEPVAFNSHALIEHLRFEILFGVHSLDDSAVPQIRRLQQEFPGVDIRLIECKTVAPNAKVGSLIDLAREAKYPVLVVNDGDIRVPRDYLRRITAPLGDSRIGLVTCLYRASATSFPARFEALGIATDFVPSVLVAPFAGVNEFGLGSTLCFRAEDLRRIGGFEAVANYIADDYQIGKRLSQAGYKVYLSEVSVETHLGAASWRDVWNHQLRWARTIRVSRAGGYVGLPITNATLWAMVAAVYGWYPIAMGLLALRFTSGLLAGAGVLRDAVTARICWLIPLRDAFGLAVWAAGLFGRNVSWRGQRLRLRPDGTIK
jgi:ceramide glucosyltransferase